MYIGAKIQLANGEIKEIHVKSRLRHLALGIFFLKLAFCRNKKESKLLKVQSDDLQVLAYLEKHLDGVPVEYNLHPEEIKQIQEAKT